MNGEYVDTTDDRRNGAGGLARRRADGAGGTGGAGIERRRHARVPWERQSLDGLMLEVEERAESWRAVPFSLVDLAAGGVGVLVGEPLEPGARVRVTFPLPDDMAGPPGGQRRDLAPWSALAEVVHARDLPTPPPAAAPAAAEVPELPHHRGVRFHQLENDAELRLLRALYGRLPAGWAVEQYRVRKPRGGGEVARYAVLRDGKRVAQGFSTYERARGRATSMHMDEVAEARRRGRGRSK